MKVDEIINCMSDYSNAFKSHAMSTFTKGVPADVAAGLNDKEIEKWYSHIEKRIQENGSTGFAVGDDLTNADVCIWRMLDTSIEWQPIPGF
jgi:hypothetical protein